MNDRVHWEDPPTPDRGHRAPESEPLLASLRKRPGNWARLADYDLPYQASNARASLMLQVSRKGELGEWEFVTRKMPDGRHAVFARYLGKEVP